MSLQAHGHGHDRHEPLLHCGQEVDRLHEHLLQFWRGDAEVRRGQGQPGHVEHQMKVCGFNVFSWNVIVCLLALVVGWITSVHAGTMDVKPDSRIEIVYIHANDCPYCRSWRYTLNGGWKRFSQKPEAKYVNLITVDKGFLRYPLKENDYPEGYRHLYKIAPNFGKGVPAWWVLVDGQPILRNGGERNWDTTVEPTIIDLVTKKLAGGGTISSGYATVNSPTP